MSASVPSLGFDPAKSGAAALLGHQGRLLALVGWKPVTRQGRKRYEVRAWRERPGQEPWVEVTLLPARAGAVGSYVCTVLAHAGHPTAKVACEDSYLGKNPKSSLMVARFSGGVVAPAEELYGLEAQWVLPGEWRAAILGLPRNATRERAKAASLRYVPTRVRGLAEAMDRLGGPQDHYTDAAGVADWLRTTTR